MKYLFQIDLLSYHQFLFLREINNQIIGNNLYEIIFLWQILDYESINLYLKEAVVAVDKLSVVCKAKEI